MLDGARGLGDLFDSAYGRVYSGVMDSDDEHVRQATLRVGTLLCGKYTVDRILGVGGMAVVYAATHRNQKQVAIKMLHAELSVHAEIRKRFLREGYVANSVKHKGAVDVIDDDVDEDGAAFIVMEYLEGQPVDAIANARGGRLPVGPALALVYELCGVLAAAHDRGIVHRDIKPANLFVTMEGELKVLDFGIARLRDSSSGQATNTGMMLGTPAFMAPEQARGETPAIGPATDIWAAGATLFNLLSGANVYDADNAQMYMIKVATTPPRSIASVLPDLPADVVTVIDKALAFAPHDRWNGAASMRGALREAYVKTVGEFSSARALAPLVGGAAPGGSVPAPAHSTKGGLGAAPSVMDPAPRSEAGVDSRPQAAGGTTAFPVTASFVKPITSKRSVAIGATLVALVGGGIAAAALRDGAGTTRAGAAIVEVAASAPSTVQVKSAEPVVATSTAAPRAAASTSGASSSSGVAPVARAAPSVVKPVAKPSVVASASSPPPTPTVSASTSPRSAQPLPVDPGSIR
jgi:serine/threonine-protein kinase